MRAATPRRWGWRFPSAKPTSPRARPVPYHAVVANLPYIGSDERGECDPELAFEPAQALFCGQDGLPLIAELIAAAPPLLAPGGVLWLEHGWKQGSAIAALGARSGLACVIIPDLAGHDRFARITAPASP